MNPTSKTSCIAPSTRNYPLTNYTVNPQLSEKQFDEFTALIANLCGTSKSLITLIDGERLWFKSNFGMPINYVNFKESYCQFTVAQKELVEIIDIENDPRVRHYQWSKGYPFIKYYAGVPLFTSDGEVIGTLCILNNVPHTLTDSQKEIMASIGQMVSSLIESKKDTITGTPERKRAAVHASVSLRSMRSITRSW